MSVRIAAGGAAADAIERVVPRLVDERVASGLTAQDPALWTDAAEDDAARSLAWTEAVADGRPLVREVEAVRRTLLSAGVDRIVLCGTGGPSIAAQVVAATQGVPLTVLDGADPVAVRRVVAAGLATTAVVVVADGPEPVETRANRNALEQAYRDAGIDPVGRFAVVTEAGDPLAEEARRAGYRVFEATPGARDGFAALTGATLVPAGLAGADLQELLDEAESELLDLAIDAPTNNGLVLAAAVAGTNPRRDKLVLVADGTHIVGFGDWVEQLVATATGKDGSGLLPVVVEVGAPELAEREDDVQIVRLVDDATDDRHDPLLAAGEVLLSGTLGELFAVWQVAVALAGGLIGIDPFDRPALDRLAADTRARLAAPPSVPPAQASTADVASRVPESISATATDLPTMITALLAAVPADGYVAITAYADPATSPGLRTLRDVLAGRAGRPVTFGWAPQVLHGAAQYRIDGPPTGVHLLVTTSLIDDLAVPSIGHGYADLSRALSGAEADALTARGRPVLRVEVDGEGGVAALLAAAAR